MINYICFFAFCAATIPKPTPNIKCDNAMGVVTQELTDKIVDTIKAGGTAFSVCGTPEYVKSHEIHLKAVGK